ncbi:uncharacterized protein F5147DRAFT_778351 [Suillus discolor]|uniref:Uncharacterized protein n=1 Tax=Suillus discolor TaxID=1912936 RepID=A0A9P7JPM3_9AGAM|nr:uncharacterized protein F5147DRAFT_778351 [Suillus discolor]KAG2096302.1 hypothetical protein F5147DRAFT_778351 [Suillus discolor]
MLFLYTPPSFYTFIGFMDFSQLDYILERVASRYKVDAQEVLDKWLEKREVRDPEGWRLLKGMPCIVGGLTALFGTLEGRGGNFPWKTLPTILARCGCILKNYPEDILMPSERRSTLAKSKGIHDLTIHERFKLADALKNDALTVKSVATDARKSLTTSRVPIIVGEVPIANSLHTRGRRGFANGRIDRFGLTHLGNTSPSKSGATSSNRRRLRVFVEVPLAPPSWRLKAIQQCSLVIEPNHSDLVPEITTINDEDAVSNATTEDKGEIDELFSSQLQEQT